MPVTADLAGHGKQDACARVGQILDLISRSAHASQFPEQEEAEYRRDSLWISVKAGHTGTSSPMSALRWHKHLALQVWSRPVL